MAKITIDGRIVEVPDNITVLEAARMHGFYIPTLCYHPKLTAFGGCRLCVVEIKGAPRAVTSCTTPVTEAMEITTTSPDLEDMRRLTVELILSDHPYDCMTCEKAGDCELQELAYYYGIKINRFFGDRRRYKTRDGNPFIERDMEKCIACGKCVRVCDEVQGVSAIDFTHRGFKTKISPAFDEDLNCEFCGQCVSVCPTGALMGKAWERKGRWMDVEKVDTVCGYCGTGCNLTLHVRHNEVIKVSSKSDSNNQGWLCVKGRFGYGFINSPDRLKKPLIKKDGAFEETSWDEAISFISKRLNEIRSEHGPDSIAGLSSARCTTEENYAFQKLIRAGVGTNNVDHCARL